MKSFLKYTLATIVGVLIINILLFFIGIGIIGAIASLAESTTTVEKNTILKIKLDAMLSDRTSSNPLTNFDFFSMSSKKSIGLNKILESIKKAAGDDNIKGIYLELSEIQGTFGGLASTEEIRNALLEFKKSGKFIYSYTNLGYSQKSYYLATVADSIYINPEAMFVLSGISAEVVFFKETLEKMGIKPEVIKVGKFKAAVEPFLTNEISDANREQMQTYMNSNWNTIISGIAEQRHLTTDRINQITNDFQFYTPEQFKDFGFFDGCIYEDQMLTILKTKIDTSATTKLRFVNITDYQNVPVIKKTEFTKDKIAIIYASGEIGMKQSETAIGPELAQTIRKAREDDNVKAIVLRVNSPGGSVLTSEIIWREVSLAAEAKPLIASMGDVAASGGYYISCPADTIIADPTTLTGSIGIFGLFFSGEKLIKDKIGLTTSVVKTNEHSDFGGGYPLGLPLSSRTLTEYERNVMQNYINRGYDSFLSKVMAGRHMTRESVDSVAQGRVWTGEDALALGLVDLLGGLEDAVKIAAAKAGLDNYNIVEYPLEKSPYEEIFSSFSAQMKTNILKNELGVYYETFNKTKEIINTQGVLARIPFNIEIN